MMSEATVQLITALLLALVTGLLSVRVQNKTPEQIKKAMRETASVKPEPLMLVDKSLESRVTVLEKRLDSLDDNRHDVARQLGHIETSIGRIESNLSQLLLALATNNKN